MRPFATFVTLAPSTLNAPSAVLFSVTALLPLPSFTESKFGFIDVAISTDLP